MGMDRTTLTRNLALLQRDGLVGIEPGTRDRREHHMRLTSAGHDMVAKALPLWQAAQEDIAKHLETLKGSPTHETVLKFLNTLNTLTEDLPV